MAAALGRAWGWLRSWGGRGPRAPEERFWEAPEELPEELPETRGASRWWRLLPASLRWWPPPPPPAASQRDPDGDFSDYGTPPPSPTPPARLSSPFRLFTRSLKVEVLPEHHLICFNLLRHLFDLCAVGFLWTVSPPTRLLLELLGVQGPLRLWLQGMAMFLVSTAGMAGLLWWVQEYLPQFALLYGVVQALVISVSLRRSVLLAVEEEEEEQEQEQGEERRDQPPL